MSWDLGHEANSKSGKGHSKNGGPNGNAPKAGKLFEKTCRKPHFRGREDKKVTGALPEGRMPVSIASYPCMIGHVSALLVAMKYHDAHMRAQPLRS
jgi:hypothetical protein